MVLNGFHWETLAAGGTPRRPPPKPQSPARTSHWLSWLQWSRPRAIPVQEHIPAPSLVRSNQAVSTPMKSSTNGLLQTEGCMNCTTQDSLWASCSSKLPARDLTLLLDLDYSLNTTLFAGAQRAEVEQHATGKANKTNPEVCCRRFKMHGRGEPLADGLQHPLPTWYC